MRELALDEQETTFTIEATDRNTISVFSCDKVWMARLEKLGIQPTRTNEYGAWYTVSLNDWSFGLHRKRQLSDEQRAAFAERMAALREVSA